MNERNEITLFNASANICRNAIDFAVNELPLIEDFSWVFDTFDGIRVDHAIISCINNYFINTGVDYKFDWDQTTFTHMDEKSHIVIEYELIDTIRQWNDTSCVTLAYIIPLYYYFGKMHCLIKALYREYGWLCMDILSELVNAAISENCTSCICVDDSTVRIQVYKKLSSEEKKVIPPSEETAFFTDTSVHPFSAKDLLVPPYDVFHGFPIYARFRELNSGKVWMEKVPIQKEELENYELWYNREYHILELCTEEDGNHLTNVIKSGYVQDQPAGIRRIKGANDHDSEFLIRIR